MKKAFVLLSGGCDSTTCLHIALNECDDVEAISINYGQRHLKESEYARRTCNKFGIEHHILNVEGILSGKGVMLSDASVEIPNISYSEIKGVSPTYVPFRNGTMLSLITAHAQKWVNKEVQELADFYQRGIEPQFDQQYAVETATNEMKDSVGIFFGAHAEDAANWAYPDCCMEFTGAMANAIYIGTYGAIRLHVPLQWMTKKEIIRKGEELGVNWAETWSCYAGGQHHCGVCPTCRARRQGFIDAGVEDPTQYASEMTTAAE